MQPPSAEPTPGSATGPGAYSPQAPAEVAGDRVASDPTVTVKEVLAALRSAAPGADVTNVLGRPATWETLFTGLVALMLRKGLISEEELLEEWKKS
jgi:hypothetical protein